MTLAVHVDDLHKGLALIALDGAFDASTAPQVKEAIEPFTHRSEVIVVLDLHSLSFIDSAGFGTLIGCQRRLRENGSELRLTRVPSHVEKLLQITALDQALPIHSSGVDADDDE